MTTGWHPQTCLRKVETHRMLSVFLPDTESNFRLGLSHFKLDFAGYYCIIGFPE